MGDHSVTKIDHANHLLLVSIVYLRPPLPSAHILGLRSDHDAATPTSARVLSFATS